MTIKPFLNIHSALSPAPADIESTDLMKGLIAVALMCLSSAHFLSFQEAHTMAANLGPTISKKDIPQVYHWIQTRKMKPHWNNGTVMPEADVKTYLAMPFPI